MYVSVTLAAMTTHRNLFKYTIWTSGSKDDHVSMFRSECEDGQLATTPASRSLIVVGSDSENYGVG